MKRSARISLTLVPIVASAFLAGCGPPERRACVDKDGRIVPDSNCSNTSANGASGSWDASGSPGGYYHWYWYHSSGYPVFGAYAPRGGSYTAPASSFSTVRGGFGSTAAGHSAGE